VNVLLLGRGPTVAQLAAVGVRRLSTDGSLAFTAYGALVRAARELLTDGTSRHVDEAMTMEDRVAAFGAGPS
jgi:2-methylisocitrate lyase-like PEP mutase family enzyme